MFWLDRWFLTFWIEPFCLVNFTNTRNQKGKTNYCETVFISKLNLKKGGSLAGWLGICFSCRPKKEDDRLRRPGIARAEPRIDIFYSQCVKFCTLTQFRFVTNLKLTFNWFPLGFQCSRVLIYFSLTKMANEAQKPLAKLEFLLVCG